MGPLMHPGDLVIVGQPEQTPLAYYYLPAGLRFSSTIGPVKDPSYVNWINAMPRYRAAQPAKVLTPMLNKLKHGQQVLYIRPLTEGVIGWKAPWTAEIRTRSAQWGKILPERQAAQDRGVGAPQLPWRLLRRGLRHSLRQEVGLIHVSDSLATEPAPAHGADITKDRPVVVLGGGPAGLTAAYLAGQAGQARRGPRVDRHARRHRAHRGAGRLPLRPRRPPLLHQGQGGRRPLARDHEGGVPQAPAPEPDLLERQVPGVPARGHGRDQEARPGRADALHGSPTCGRRSSPRAARTRSRSGSPTASASASTTTSSRPTRRSCGAFRPTRSGPSGPPSGSRACPSSAPPRPRSSATRATRSSR